jgi:hypothetical protein
MSPTASEKLQSVAAGSSEATAAKQVVVTRELQVAMADVTSMTTEDLVMECDVFDPMHVT